MATPSPAAQRLPARRRTARQRLFDLALTGFVILFSLGQSFGPALDHEIRGGGGTFGFALAVVAGVAIYWRRRNPLLVLAVVEAMLFIHLVAIRADARVGALPLMVAMYTVATRLPRASSLRAALVVAAINAAVIIAQYTLGNSPSISEAFFVTVIVAGAWAIGDNIGTRRAYLAGLVERATRLEREQETATQRAALEERTRIARELHDVVAHHVSAIAVQAGAAEEIAESNPQRARAVLATIQQTSRQALAEMRALVGVLHSDDGAALAPQPHLADVEDLAAQSRRAGLDVRVHVDGTPRALPEALDLSAYRIVQEALTNALKHAGAVHVDVTVRYASDSVELLVEDDGAAGELPEPLPGGGRGIVGMRERVALFHGRLELGRTAAGGFRVRAVLPLGAGSA
jgi:signal transduction histidine kinase